MVRRALGATSGGVARLFLVEGALLGAAGGALGLAFAVGLPQVLPTLAPAGLPRTEMIGLAGTPVAIAITVTVLGTVAGVGVALLVSRLLVTLLFEIGPADPVTLLGVCAMLLTVAVLAAYLPARRATRVDPMRALRSE